MLSGYRATKHIESDSLLAYFFLAFGKEDFFVRAYRVFSRQQADCVTKQRNGYEAILTHYFALRKAAKMDKKIANTEYEELKHILEHRKQSA